MTYTDPTGRFELGAVWSAICTASKSCSPPTQDFSGIFEFFELGLEFVSGGANAFATDFVFGAGRHENSSAVYGFGQSAGDALAAPMGVQLIGLGFGGELFGTALDLSGGGAIAGVPVQVVSGVAVLGGMSAVVTSFSKMNDKRRSPSSRNDRESRQVRNAADRAGLKPQFFRRLHDEIAARTLLEQRKLTFQEITTIAHDIAAGRL